MKLIIQSGRIAGTATDDYAGPMDFIVAPEGFDISRIDDFAVIDGVLTPRIPQSVTQRQARLALLASGKLALVDAAIETLPEPIRTQARIEWEYSQDVERSNPLLSLIAPALGLDDDDLDALFSEAAGL